MKRCLVLVAVFGALLASTEAFALDAWRDRRGLFVGVGIGGGQGTTNSNLLGEDENGVGLMFMGRIGGGLSKKLTLDASLQRWAYGSESGDITTTATHWLGAAAANFFLTKQVFVRGGMGIARAAVKVENEATQVDADTSKSGLGFLLGGGIEFFMNANVAGSITIQAQQHVGDAGFTAVNGFVGLTWY